MSERKWILVFGIDAMLLDTRTRLLESAGFQVARSASLEEVECQLNQRVISLLLLCHTLSSSDCERAIMTAHSINPKTVTLVLAAVTSPCIEKSDVFVHQMSGPQKLLETVEAVLNGKLEK
ncbi:hypothetical protein [Granulicella tundricola]|uniref:Response regulatory domain-containing protein n=1 Tax=Granulicella tundricola (strain ATCC BAA-1859 / DSM 23138 / MP5ACTX9) TaxID=1198114 RepID=E8WWD0_GRATM|nr:hypothetical protein [Granulicella tundricola]ADW68513.1 hypothetical protein AciX9_1460 [Granulicella tundricola MP5ACTX9]